MTKNGQLFRVSWFIDFAYSSRNHHGGILRFLNFSRELIARGHQVYLIYTVQTADAAATQEWFQGLQNSGAISGFARLELLLPPRWRVRLGTLLFHPAFNDYLLRSARKEVIERARLLLQQQQSDLFLISNRRLHFLSVALAKEAPCIIDFCDSESLYFYREAKHQLANQQWRSGLYSLRRMIGEVLIERHYGRHATRNMVVSAVDQQVLNRHTGSPEKNVTVLNGVGEVKPSVSVSKIPNQIIFSGNMNFAPNYGSALWLTDHVFPLILRQIPDAKLVIAGANPVPELKKRETENIKITGFVEDLAGLISASSLFVAPMVSGSGFKNKIAEAIFGGTYVVSTPMGVEFLQPELQSLFTVASTPETFASQVVKLLQDPFLRQARLEKVRAALEKEISWAGSTDKLLVLMRSVCEERARTSSAQKRMIPPTPDAVPSRITN